MTKDIVKKKAAYPTELTEMQRRFCEYLIMNEGRTTRTEAALHAGYEPKEKMLLSKQDMQKNQQHKKQPD